MKSLSKAQQKELDGITADLRASAVSLEKEHSAMVEAIQEYNRYVTEHNEKIVAAREFLDGIKETLEEYHSEKSEKWQESDVGQDYQAWIDNVNEALDGLEELEEVEVPDEPSVDGIDGVDQMQAAP